jgi:hypothetical protein
MVHVVVGPILVELEIHLDTLLVRVEDLRHGTVSAQEEGVALIVVLPMLHVSTIRIQPSLLHLGRHVVRAILDI